MARWPTKNDVSLSILSPAIFDVEIFWLSKKPALIGEAMSGVNSRAPARGEIRAETMKVDPAGKPSSSHSRRWPDGAPTPGKGRGDSDIAGDGEPRDLTAAGLLGWEDRETLPWQWWLAFASGGRMGPLIKASAGGVGRATCYFPARRRIIASQQQMFLPPPRRPLDSVGHCRIAPSADFTADAMPPWASAGPTISWPSRWIKPVRSNCLHLAQQQRRVGLRWCESEGGARCISKQAAQQTGAWPVRAVEAVAAEGRAGWQLASGCDMATVMDKLAP